MNNFFLLTKVLLKNTSFSFGHQKNKKLSNILLMILLMIAMIPLLYSLYELFSVGFEYCSLFQQNTAFFHIVLQFCSLLIFMFGIFIVPSIYYFGEDIETLLRLPLKPHVILASKLVQCMVSEFLFVLLIMIPLGISYFVVEGFSMISLIFMIIISLILPIYPLILCSIIVMVLMRFTPFFANRDRFQLIGGCLGVLFSLLLSWGINTLFRTTSQSELMYLFITGNDSFSKIFASIFPLLHFGAKTIVSHDVISLILFLGFHILSIVIFLGLANQLYFKGVIGIHQTSKKKTHTNKMNYQTSHPFFSYLKKEMILLLKTPTYALNCVGMIFILPISFIIGFMSGGGDLDLSIFASYTFEHLEGLMIIIGLCSGLLFASLNQTSSTALSREGSQYIFMKYIPLAYKTQMLAKVCCGIIFSLLMMIVTFGFVFYFFPYLPLFYDILIIVSATVSLVCFNFIALIIDFLHPKLVWDNEAAAVKQNLFAFLSMLLAIAICVLLVLLIIFLPQSYWFIIGIIGLLSMLLITIILYINLDKIGNYCMKRIDS